MKKKIEEKTFFMEGTLRICGTLDIEKALEDCLEFIQNYIPAEEIYLHRYLRGIGATRVLAMADKKGGQFLNMTLQWSDEMARWQESDDYPRNIIANKADEHPVFAQSLKQSKRSRVSIILIRLEVEKNWIGGVSLVANGWDRFTDEHLNLFLLLKRPFTIALSNYLQYKELLELKNRLADDKDFLQNQLQKTSGYELIGADFGLKRVMEMVQQVAALDSPVMLRGETGTGKEVVASTIHNLSNRRKGPFITVNCGAIPDSLMDSELFGHEKGAFTGALERTRGRFERAHGGTIFLDEIGELSPSAQMRLLRVLQEKKIERVGGSDSIDLDIRVIAATHRNLESLIQEGRFREDLYFRLQVFPIIIPPLRHRTMDIPALVKHVLTKKTRALGFSKIPELLPGVLEGLSGYPWPGNVRELENMVERALILNRRGPISLEELLVNPIQSANPINDDAQKAIETKLESLLFDQVVINHLQSVLSMTKGKINGEKGAAELLGLNASTLRQKLRKMNIPFGRQSYKK
jgi:transcriptional regulator with GAF, ATPase, and Fis domain